MHAWLAHYTELDSRRSGNGVAQRYAFVLSMSYVPGLSSLKGYKLHRQPLVRWLGTTIIRQNGRHLHELVCRHPSCVAVFATSPEGNPSNERTTTSRTSQRRGASHRQGHASSSVVATTISFLVRCESCSFEAVEVGGCLDDNAPDVFSAVVGCDGKVKAP